MSLKLGKHWNELMDVEAKKIPAEYQSPVVAGAELERYGMRKGSNAHPVLDESVPAIKWLLARAQMGKSGAHVSRHYQYYRWVASTPNVSSRTKAVSLS